MFSEVFSQVRTGPDNGKTMVLQTFSTDSVQCLVKLSRKIFENDSGASAEKGSRRNRLLQPLSSELQPRHGTYVALIKHQNLEKECNFLDL